MLLAWCPAFACQLEGRLANSQMHTYVMSSPHFDCAHEGCSMHMSDACVLKMTASAYLFFQLQTDC